VGAVFLNALLHLWGEGIEREKDEMILGKKFDDVHVRTL
jgi:hypothetical protein